MGKIASAQLLFFFLVALGVFVRLPGVTDDLILDLHSWRQTDSAGFAHGYLIEGINPFAPRASRYPCNLASEPFGKVEAELPLHNWLAAVPLYILGFDFPPAPYLRSLGILFFVGTCFYLFALARSLGADAIEANGAVLALCVFPLSVFFTRTPQPDGPALMFAAAMLLHLDRYLGHGKPRDAVAASVFGAVLLLIKISNLFMGIPALFLVLVRTGLRAAVFNRGLWAVAGGMILPSVWWYWHAHGFPWTFGIWNVEGHSKFSTAKLITESTTWDRLGHRVVRDLLTWPGLLLTFAGLRQMSRTYVRVATVWLVGIVLFICVSLRGNLMHNYYQLPLVLPCALLVGAAVRDLLKLRWFGGIVIAAALLILLHTAYDVLHVSGSKNDAAFFNKHEALRAPIELVRQHVPAHERFVSTDRNPTLYYNSRHQGWFVEPVNARALRRCLLATQTRFVLTPAAHERHITALNAGGLDGRRLQAFEREGRWILWRLE